MKRTVFGPLRTIADVRARCTISPGGCWEWQQALTTYGYPKARINGRTALVHRFVLEQVRGVSLGTCFACHHCDNPRCCNPEHLFIGTAADNNRDCIAKGRQPAKSKTHCKHGHAFTPQNTYVRNGLRKCRACSRRIQAAKTARLRDQAKAEVSA